MIEDLESQQAQIDKGIITGIENPRIGFIKKVYGIISMQLILTTFLIYLGQTSLSDFFRSNSPLAICLLIFSIIGSLITMTTIVCYISLARTVPTNYILLGIFTLCEAYGVAYSTSFFESEHVIVAAFLTTTITLTLTLYAWTTKRDVTVYTGAIWILAWGLLAFSFLMFLLFFWSSTVLTFTSIVVSILGTVIYGFYLVVDSQLIVGGRRYGLGVDDYIIAAVIIYVDIIILFMRILQIVASLSKR